MHLCDSLPLRPRETTLLESAQKVSRGTQSCIPISICLSTVLRRTPVVRPQNQRNSPLFRSLRHRKYPPDPQWKTDGGRKLFHRAQLVGIQRKHLPLLRKSDGACRLKRLLHTLLLLQSDGAPHPCNQVRAGHRRGFLLLLDLRRSISSRNLGH